jgi:hypothetical protein
MRHESFVWFDRRQATGMMGFPQVFIENKALEVKLLAPLFHSAESCLSGQGSMLCVSDRTNNKGWKDDLVVKKENTSVGAE